MASVRSSSREKDGVIRRLNARISELQSKSASAEQDARTMQEQLNQILDANRRDARKAEQAQAALRREKDALQQQLAALEACFHCARSF